MRILITGATGLVGGELVKLLLQNGISIHYLTLSDKEKQAFDRPNCTGFHWNPEQGIIDENCLLGVDAIIHLAGATISKRWTNKQKQAIVESRVMSSNVLFKALKAHPNEVRQIVSASAIGIYPDSHSVIYTEDSTAVDPGFLAHVVMKWEESVDKFKLLNMKVCKLRTATVFAKQGGALPVMAKPIKMGFGSAFGNGRQVQSWIHVHDLARMYFFAVQNGWEGVYNAASPNPISNMALTKMIAKTLDKPLWLPNIPRFVMKMLLGEMHELLFNDKNVSPQKAINAGFTFDFPEPEPALRDTLQ
jgi:uncharacterized protein (TIGR01777 family)